MISIAEKQTREELAELDKNEKEIKKLMKENKPKRKVDK